MAVLYRCSTRALLGHTMRNNRVMSETIHEATFSQALDRARHIAPVMGVETLSLAKCAGRILAHDVHAQSDMPPFAASRVDGWAVSGDGPWRIIGDLTAGHTFVGELQSGECIHIATGAPIPAGTTSVLRDEASSQVEMVVSANEAFGQGNDIRPQGIEAHEGELLISAGTVLAPSLIGLCAAAGYAALGVRKQIGVTVFILGDELVHEGTSGEGKVRDALGPQIPLWIENLGAVCEDVMFIPDTQDALELAIRSCESELVITTGSTAAGPEDHLHHSIESLGGLIDVDAVLMRPGYHTLFGTIGSQVILGLPGNPQSAIIGLLTMGRAILDGAYQMSESQIPQRRSAVDISAPVKEVRIALCSESVDGVSPVEHVDSSMLRGFVAAHGFAVIPAGGISAKLQVDWISLS